MTRFSFVSVAALACVAVVKPLTAQTFPTPDPVIKRIYALGMDSTDVYRQAHVLLDSLGPRLMGTPNIKRAQDWLVNTYKSWGIDAKEEKYGTWRGWERGYSHIDLISPRIRSLEGQMVGYSPGTGGKDVILSTIILPRFKDSTEFVKWLPQAKGKLVLTAPPKLSCRPQEQWVAMGTPESVRRIDSLNAAIGADWQARIRATGYSMALGGGSLGVRLEQGGAGGIITSRPKLVLGAGGGRGGAGGGRGGRGGAAQSVSINVNLANGTATIDSTSLAAALAAAVGRGGGSLGGYGAMEVFETYNVKTPAIALDCEDYGLVYRLTEAGDTPKIKLNLQGKLLGEQPVFNVVAMVKGSEKPDEYVVLSSHFDSWDGSSGATDNGTGTLTMLEAMRILRQVYPHPKRTIIAGHWSGEEEGEVGSKAFTEDHPEVIKELQAVFNQDNGTGRIQRMGGGGMVKSPEHLSLWMSKVPLEFKSAVAVNAPGGPSGGSSDGASFTCYGVPTNDLGAASWDYNSLTWHTERDTYDKVVFDDLKFNATFTAMMAYMASEDPTMVPHEKVDIAAQQAAQQAAAAARLDSIRRINPKLADSLANVAAQNAAAGRGGRGAGGGRGGWPVCEKAPRVTNPRLR
jgi:carboxypeptidase Q